MEVGIVVVAAARTQDNDFAPMGVLAKEAGGVVDVCRAAEKDSGEGGPPHCAWASGWEPENF